MSELATHTPNMNGFESALLQGDLSKLSPEQRTTYYLKVCESVGLNPLTKPFDYLELDGKTVLYAKRDCTDQLRVIHGVSIKITDRQTIDGVYIVTASATDKTGRIDESTGAVPTLKENGEWKTAQSGKKYFNGNGTFTKITGDALANALMKAETKAKRRVTLSICGLGMLDETEMETIPGAVPAKIETPIPSPKPTAMVHTPQTNLVALVEKWTAHDFKGDGKTFGSWIARTITVLPEIAVIPDDLKDLTEWVRDAAGMGDLQEWHDMSGEQLITGKAGVVEWLEQLKPKG